MICSRVLCLLVLFLGRPALAAPLGGTAERDSEPWGGAPKGNPINNESWNFTSRHTGGFVKAVAKDAITLYRPAMKQFHLRHDTLTGKLLEKKDGKTLSAWPAKRFILGEELAKGAYVQPPTTPQETYRIADVRVGDWVSIKFDRRNGVDICQTICISRRPGGPVPPAPGEKPDEFRKWHELANARQDWEENGTAFPRKYWPSYLGDDGKIYQAPFPKESTLTVPISLAKEG